MKYFAYFLILMIVIIISNSTYAQYAPEGYPVFKRKEQLVLGNFFRFQDQQIIPVTLLDFKKEAKPVASQRIQYYLIDNASQQYNSTGWGANLSYKEIMFSGSLSLSGSALSRKDSRTIKTQISLEFLDTTYQTNSSYGVHFNDSAKKVIGKFGKKGFEQIFGPIYISSITYGTKVTINVTLTFTDANQANTFKAKLNANSATGLSGGANYDNYVKDASQNGYISLDIETNGVSTELNNVADLLNGLDYSKFSSSLLNKFSMFLKSSKRIPVPLYATFASTSTLTSTPGMDFEAVTNKMLEAINLYQKDEKRIYKATIYINDVNYNKNFDPAIINCLKTARMNLQVLHDSLENLIKNNIKYGFTIDDKVYRPYRDSMLTERFFIDTIFAPCKCNDTSVILTSDVIGTGSTLGKDTTTFRLKCFKRSDFIKLNIKGDFNVSPDPGTSTVKKLFFYVYANGKKLGEVNDPANGFYYPYNMKFQYLIPRPDDDILEILIINNYSKYDDVSGFKTGSLMFKKGFIVSVEGQCDSVKANKCFIPALNNANFTTMQSPYFSDFNGIQSKYNINNTLYVNPNPTHSDVTISRDISDPAIVTITDLQGRLMKQIIFNSQTVTINLEEFPKGIYLLKLQNELGIVVKKILKD